MKFLFFLPLLCFFLSACGGGDYAPAELKDSKIVFNITNITSDAIPPDQYVKTGVSISHFDTTNFFSDYSDLGTGHFGGTYTYTKGEGNKVTIEYTSFVGISFTTDLTFLAKNVGTFVNVITVFPGVQLKSEGTFILTNQKFNILPKDINNQNFNLMVQQVDRTLPEVTSLEAGQTFLATFSGGRQTFTLPNGTIITNPSYKLSEANTYELLVSGKFQESGKSNVLHLTYNSFVSGTFSLDIGENKNVVSGAFNSAKFTSINTSSPLKGKTINGLAITSQITGITYPYTVYLPKGYDTSAGTYPIIYVTDGQWNNDFSYLLEKHHKDMIMVAVAQGPTERRTIDFIPPGTTDYIKFLKTELTPLIEKNYRHNGNRSFFGQSLGGLLGAALVAEESETKPFFKNYLLIDAALWGYSPDLLAMEEAHKSLPIRLLLTHTRKGNGLVVNNYAERVKAKHYENLFLVNLPYNTLTHEEMGPVSFEDLLEFIDDTPQ